MRTKTKSKMTETEALLLHVECGSCGCSYDARPASSDPRVYMRPMCGACGSTDADQIQVSRLDEDEEDQEEEDADEED